MSMTWNKIGISWRKTCVSGKEEKWLWEAVGEKKYVCLGKIHLWVQNQGKHIAFRIQAHKK